jgi:hypothetical protein
MPAINICLWNATDLSLCSVRVKGKTDSELLQNADNFLHDRHHCYLLVDHVEILTQEYFMWEKNPIGDAPLIKLSLRDFWKRYKYKTEHEEDPNHRPVTLLFDNDASKCTLEEYEKLLEHAPNLRYNRKQFLGKRVARKILDKLNITV